MTTIPHPHAAADEGDLALVTRASLAYMLVWMTGFIVLAAVARLFLPPLAGLSSGASAVFILMSSGFGIIPGMMHGVGAAEALLDHGES